MVKNLNVTVKKEVALESYLLIRGIKVSPSGTKKVIAEQEIKPPISYADRSAYDTEIAEFLLNTGADFCSIENNYRIKPVECDLPVEDDLLFKAGRKETW